MADKTRISATFFSAGDMYALRKAGDYDAIAGYKKGSGESRGFLINNGVGNPSVADLDPGKDGPLVYDIRPVMAFEPESGMGAAAAKGSYALMHPGSEDKVVPFRCSNIEDRGPALVADEAVAQVKLDELPDGVSPTMEVLGADKAMEDFTELADRSHIEVFDSAGTILYETEVECVYDRDARLAPDFTRPALSFNIGHEIAVGDTVGNIGEGDIGEDLDEEERGYEL